MPDKMRCALCNRSFSRKTVRRHMRGRCTQSKSLAQRRSKPPSRRHRNPHRPIAPLPRYSRSPPSPQHHHARTLGSGDGTHLAVSTAVPAPRHPNFAFDTPGAGPSSHNYELAPDVETMDDDQPVPGVTLADTAPWLVGLSAQSILEQEPEAEIVIHGGKYLGSTLTIHALISLGRVYSN